MDEREVAAYWEANAETWTLLSRQGFDVYRDAVNTPAFLRMLPDVRGLRGLDIGCGEGHNTRLLAGLGAAMCAVDIAATFVRLAEEENLRRPTGIRYLVASGQGLPFPDAQFDFATAFMSLMDTPRPDLALREAHRVLRPGGFLQFSITHPCFLPPHWRKVRDETGNVVAFEVGRYFERTEGELDVFLFGAAPADLKQTLPPFRIPRFHRTLSEWLNSIAGAGFRLEQAAEPRADEESAARVPKVADTRIVPYFLHLRCRKPE